MSPSARSANQPHRRTLEGHLATKGLRWTRQRQSILDVFLSTKEHLTSEEFHRLVAKEHPSVGLATLYRTLKLFVEAGIASERTFSGAVTRYEVRHQHHNHIICSTCGRIVEFEDAEIEARQERIAEQHGFRLSWHRHELYGQCARCQRTPGAGRARGAGSVGET